MLTILLKCTAVDVLCGRRGEMSGFVCYVIWLLLAGALSAVDRESLTVATVSDPRYVCFSISPKNRYTRLMSQSLYLLFNLFFVRRSYGGVRKCIISTGSWKLIRLAYFGVCTQQKIDRALIGRIFQFAR